MTPDELSAWLETARRIFSEVFRADNVCLRIIVANARNPRQAVEYRTPAPDAASRVYGLANERVEVHFHEQPNAPQIVEEQGLPTLPVVELSQDERDILRVVRRRRLQGKDICRELRRKYNGTTKNLLSRMANIEARKLLNHNSAGYIASVLGATSYDAACDQSGGVED